jgi:hypothetical protein
MDNSIKSEFRQGRIRDQGFLALSAKFNKALTRVRGSVSVFQRGANPVRQVAGNASGPLFGSRPDSKFELMG